jgi:hypothetical protein
VESLDQLAIKKKLPIIIGEKLYGLRRIEIVVELLKEYTAQLQITFMARRGSSGMRADSVNAK